VWGFAPPGGRASPRPSGQSPAARSDLPTDPRHGSGCLAGSEIGIRSWSRAGLRVTASASGRAAGRAGRRGGKVPRETFCRRALHHHHVASTCDRSNRDYASLGPRRDDAERVAGLGPPRGAAIAPKAIPASQPVPAPLGGVQGQAAYGHRFASLDSASRRCPEGTYRECRGIPASSGGESCRRPFRPRARRRSASILNGISQSATPGAQGAPAEGTGDGRRFDATSCHRCRECGEEVAG